MREMKTSQQKQTKETKSPDQLIWEQAMAELKVCERVLVALKPLSQNERRRILNYMWDRYVVNPEPETTKEKGKYE